MKKRSIWTSITLLFAFIIILFGCKKEETIAELTPDYNMQVEDHAFISGELDAITNDAIDVVETDTAFAGRTPHTICNATAELDTSSAERVVTITYNGNNCAENRSRTGIVTLSIPADKRWSDTGAILTVTYKNLKITRVSDNKDITLNGVKTITNVVGGRIPQEASDTSVDHLINSNNLSVTFDDGTQRQWYVAKKRTFQFENGIVISTSGNHAEGGVGGISEWGTNRNGRLFTTVIAEPLVVRQDCAWRLVSGRIVHHRLVTPVSVTFGLDASGNPTSCPGTSGNFYYKIEWKNLQNVMQSIINPY